MTPPPMTPVVEASGEHLSEDDRTRPIPTAAPEHRGGVGHGSDRFRGDVAGLRAIAVGLVLLYHAGLPFLPGGFVGVDVFFVISGFLITGQLVNEIDRSGRISLTGFYARRAKRILPAASVVLAATAAAVWLFASRERWEDIARDIVGSAIYVVNWRFADQAVDYLARDTDPSPVQHYWSLAVEEQFYLVWPLLIIVAIAVARRIGRRNVRPILWMGLVLVAVPSFAWSIVETAHSPASAFFVSTTRMWELAIGAGVALAAASFARIPRAAAIVLGWAGLAAVVAAGLVVTTSTRWPGYAAALPTFGAAAVIVAGAAAGARGPVAILGTPPFRWVGDLSYSLYLWHWPMIVLATAHWGGLSLTRGLAVAAASVVPAWLTFKLVENPLRYSRAISGSPRLALSLGGNFTFAGICAGLALLVLATSAAAPSVAAKQPARGAGLLLGSVGTGSAPLGPVPDRFDFITPDPLRAGKDLPETTDHCFQQMVEPDVIWCTYGNPHGKTTVALVGDSKMDQWLPAFQLLAAQNDWKIVVAFKGGCPFMTGQPVKANKEPYRDCEQWNTALLPRLVAERPAYVFTSQTSDKAGDGAGHATVDAMVAGMRTAWSRLAAVGSKVVVVANNPGPPQNIVQCADKNRTRLSVCAFDRASHDRDPGYQTQVKAVAGTDVKMIDLFDTVCPTVKCPAVFGNVMVYRRGSHITATYVRSMAPQLAQALTTIGIPVRFTPPS
jgi:peptidoglycan/LPS O-acetylase OafA/YrhL